LPSTFTALTELGTCSMAPVSAAMPAATAASVTAEASTRCSTVPSASSVVVEAPRRMVAV
jgi:hypothetical protein